MNQSFSACGTAWQVCIFISLCALPHHLHAKDRLSLLQSTSKTVDQLAYKSVAIDLDNYFSSVTAHDTINTRLIKATDIFMHRPYQYDSVGDGEHADFDTRPLLATHGFDCLSLTNMVLAMVLSVSKEDFHNKYVRIRYQDAFPSYFSRHHFMSFQWRPSNIGHGFIKNISTNFVDANHVALAKTLRTPVNYKRWLIFQKNLLEKHKPLTSLQRKIFTRHYHASSSLDATLSYISFSDFLAHTKNTEAVLAQITPGSIIYFVTPQWDLRSVIGTHLDIGHLGFVVAKNQTLYFRHASLSGVVEIPLVDYIKSLAKKNKAFKGFVVDRIS